jgi:hypothetical protein
MSDQNSANNRNQPDGRHVFKQSNQHTAKKAFLKTHDEGSVKPAAARSNLSPDSRQSLLTIPQPLQTMPPACQLTPAAGPDRRRIAMLNYVAAQHNQGVAAIQRQVAPLTTERIIERLVRLGQFIQGSHSNGEWGTQGRILLQTVQDNAFRNLPPAAQEQAASMARVITDNLLTPSIQVGLPTGPRASRERGGGQPFVDPAVEQLQRLRIMHSLGPFGSLSLTVTTIGSLIAGGAGTTGADIDWDRHLAVATAVDAAATVTLTVAARQRVAATGRSYSNSPRSGAGLPLSGEAEVTNVEAGAGWAPGSGFRTSSTASPNTGSSGGTTATTNVSSVPSAPSTGPASNPGTSSPTASPSRPSENSTMPPSPARPEWTLEREERAARELIQHQAVRRGTARAAQADAQRTGHAQAIVQRGIIYIFIPEGERVIELTITALKRSEMSSIIRNSNFRTLCDRINEAWNQTAVWAGSRSRSSPYE